MSLTEDVFSMAECDDDCDLSPEWELEMILKVKEVIDSDDYLSLPTGTPTRSASSAKQMPTTSGVRT